MNSGILITRNSGRFDSKYLQNVKEFSTWTKEPEAQFEYDETGRRIGGGFEICLRKLHPDYFKNNDRMFWKVSVPPDADKFRSDKSGWYYVSKIRLENNITDQLVEEACSTDWTILEHIEWQTPQMAINAMKCDIRAKQFVDWTMVELKFTDYK